MLSCWLRDCMWQCFFQCLVWAKGDRHSGIANIPGLHIANFQHRPFNVVQVVRGRAFRHITKTLPIVLTRQWKDKNRVQNPVQGAWMKSWNFHFGCFSLVPLAPTVVGLQLPSTSWSCLSMYGDRPCKLVTCSHCDADVCHVMVLRAAARCEGLQIIPNLTPECLRPEVESWWQEVLFKLWFQRRDGKPCVFEHVFLGALVHVSGILSDVGGVLQRASLIIFDGVSVCIWIHSSHRTNEWIAKSILQVDFVVCFLFSKCSIPQLVWPLNFPHPNPAKAQRQLDGRYLWTARGRWVSLLAQVLPRRGTKMTKTRDLGMGEYLWWGDADAGKYWGKVELRL